MSVTGLLVYKRDHAKINAGFIQMLIQEAGQVGMTLQLVFEEELQYGIKNTKSFLAHPTVDFSAVDFVIIRAIHPLLSKQFESCGIRCFNSSYVSEICNDKAKTHQFVSGLGIPSLDTYFTAYNSYREVEGFPLVLKQVDGHGGKDVHLVTSNEEVMAKLAAMPSKRFILQEFSDNPGKDVRVFVLGNEVIGAVLRESSVSFKANYTLGGHVSPYCLNHDEVEMVKSISSALKADFIGVDFLVNQQNELIFNEVEDVVGCRSLYATSDVNAAKLYIEYIDTIMKKRQQ